jgi:hypothetical protein
MRGTHNPKKEQLIMVTYVRIRTIKPGQFENAVNSLRKYKEFLSAEYDMDVNFGTEVGRLGTVVGLTQFENAQQWEDALNSLRGNSKYVGLIDESASFFEVEIEEHLILDLPL